MTIESVIPKHVAIIMDGNGRWARQRGLPRLAGHRAGVEAARKIVEASRELGIGVLTLYTFSTENWKRPKREIDSLFKLLSDYIDREGEKLNKNNIRFRVLGDLAGLPKTLRARLEGLIESTKENSRMVLNLALNYGSRAEILRAARDIARDCLEGRVRPDEIDEGLFSGRLYTKDVPDPDLLIRTSGEMRVSNFLLWQICYAEIYVTRKLWPDFGKRDLEEAIEEFKKRSRRFGA
jgi:undecaprenyl diphosphate synthase